MISEEKPRYPGPYTSDEPTPYERSELARSEVEKEREGLEYGLYGGRKPYYPIQHERYEHRVVCYLKAQGMSNTEIAHATGLTSVAVSNIVRQPWAEKMILDLIREQGQEGVFAMLRGAAPKAVARLIAEMDNENAKASERITAADKILDRTFGKAVQPIEHNIQQRMEKLSDEELERVIANYNRPSTVDCGEAAKATS